MAISPNEQWIVMGYPGDTGPGNIGNAGSIEMFKLDAGSWTSKQQIYSTNMATNFYFGQSVSLTDDTMIVGEPEAIGVSNNAIDTGVAYIYRRSGCLLYTSDAADE